MAFSKRLVLHPFMAAMYPVLFLLSVNISQINPREALNPLFLSLLAALFLMLGVGTVSKSYHLGGFLTTVLVSLFFSYGHVYNQYGDLVYKRHIILLTLWAFFFLAALFFAVAVVKFAIMPVENMTQALNIIFFFLLLQPLVEISLFTLRANSAKNISVSPHLYDFSVAGEDDYLPDIYYIIPDGYARTDILNELFDYDNSGFINYLKDSGFYVAEQSHSNYTQTALSLASSMNLDYLENLIEVDDASSDRSVLKDLIVDSELRHILEARGYSTVSVAGGYDLTVLEDATFLFDRTPINQFEELILTTSAARPFKNDLVYARSCEQKYTTTFEIFDYLKKVPSLPGPKFVFVHILSPHPAFVIDAEGNLAQKGICTLRDGTSKGTRTEYKQGYAGQVSYTTILLKDAITQILAKSPRPPVIIIQGDHGSGLYYDEEESEESCLRERTAILNAYYIPSEFDNPKEFYAGITPVNSFRALLNVIFNARIPLLEDKFYYSKWEKPYQFENITDKIEDSCKNTN